MHEACPPENGSESKAESRIYRFLGGNETTKRRRDRTPTQLSQERDHAQEFRVGGVGPLHRRPPAPFHADAEERAEPLRHVQSVRPSVRPSRTRGIRARCFFGRFFFPVPAMEVARGVWKIGPLLAPPTAGQLRSMPCKVVW
jgi:hypothetical protein